VARSLNKVQLIGNLTRDPELRYTPQGTAVCTFGLATNRYWTTETGEKKEEAEFHRIIAWSKLAELCSQLLTKGRKIYVEGRLQTRTWTGQDGVSRTTVEIVINDMLILDSRGIAAPGAESFDVPDSLGEPMPEVTAEAATSAEKPGDEKKKKPGKNAQEIKEKPNDESEDIPF